MIAFIIIIIIIVIVIAILILILIVNRILLIILISFVCLTFHTFIEKGSIIIIIPSRISIIITIKIAFIYFSTLVLTGTLILWLMMVTTSYFKINYILVCHQCSSIIIMSTTFIVTVGRVTLIIVGIAMGRGFEEWIERTGLLADHLDWVAAFGAV